MSRLLLLQTAAGPTIRPKLFAAATTGTSEIISFQNASKIGVFIEWDGTITGGEIVFETSAVNPFSGTWANEGNSVGASNTQDRIQVEGPVLWGRLRFNSDATGGGTATAWVEAIGKD